MDEGAVQVIQYPSMVSKFKFAIFCDLNAIWHPVSQFSTGAFLSWLCALATPTLLTKMWKPSTCQYLQVDQHKHPSTVTVLDGCCDSVGFIAALVSRQLGLEIEYACIVLSNNATGGRDASQWFCIWKQWVWPWQRLLTCIGTVLDILCYLLMRIYGQWPWLQTFIGLSDQ